VFFFLVVWTFWVPPLPCRSGPKEEVFLSGVVCVTPKLSKELAVSVPEKVDLMVLVSSSASILSPIDHFVVLTRD
jgi:hypothetical protein